MKQTRKRARISETEAAAPTTFSAPASLNSGVTAAASTALMLIPPPMTDNNECGSILPPKARNRGKARAKRAIGTRPKARSVAGDVNLPPSREQLKGCLEFKLKKHIQRYESLHTRSIIPCKFFDKHTLDELELFDDVKRYFDAIGWGSLLDFEYPTYTELLQEFYTTFEYTPPKEFTSDTSKLIKFRLMNQDFKLSFTELNVALGLVTLDVARTPEFAEYIGDFPLDFEKNMYRIWYELTDTHEVYSKESKAKCLKDPALRIVHKFLAYTVSGRASGANVVTMAELCWLWCMTQGKKADFGRWIILQFQSVVRNKSDKRVKGLILGPYITRLAVHYGKIQVATTNLHNPFPIEKIDRDFLLASGVLKQVPRGVLTIRGIDFENSSTDDSGDDIETKRVWVRLEKLTTQVATIRRDQKKIITLLERVLEKDASTPPPPS